MHFIKTFIASAVLVLVTASMVFAQGQQQAPQMPEVPAPDEISDDELLTFVDASDAIQPIQQKAQDDMRDVVEDEGIEFERFQQIMMAMQNPQMADQLEISAEEEQTIQQVEPQLRNIEEEAGQEIRAEITDQGIDIERYQAIFMSLQQHPELMERLEVLLDENE